MGPSGHLGPQAARSQERHVNASLVCDVEVARVSKASLATVRFTSPRTSPPTPSERLARILSRLDIRALPLAKTLLRPQTLLGAERVNIGEFTMRDASQSVVVTSILKRP